MSLDYDPYAILDIAPETSTNDIKAAFRNIVQRLHPDVNSHPEAASQFQDASAAYGILTDPVARKKLDARLAQHPDGGAVQDEDGSFLLEVLTSKRSVLPLPEAQVLYLLADIKPDLRSIQQHGNREARLNLALVLDRSNSMNGVRIEKVKAAAHQIMDNMAEEDVISVVTFNDRAQVLIPATPLEDRPALKAMVSLMTASGGTEIYKGLAAGMGQISQNLDPRVVNHMILLTDGHTFGDQDLCLELAGRAADGGVGISAMGLGHDWNDEFLDQLASKTGGNTTYINSAAAVVKFLNDEVRSLINAFAERVVLSVAPDPDVQIESAFKLSPHPQPLLIEEGRLLLGNLQYDRPLSILLQLQLPANMSEGNRHIARLVAKGDILINRQQKFCAVGDPGVQVSQSATTDYAPTAILDALSKLTLYRLQERANEALENGNVAEATRRLENLATRLLEMGQDELSNQARDEARRVAHTSGLSTRGRKTLKYQTRYLLTTHLNEDDIS